MRYFEPFPFQKGTNLLFSQNSKLRPFEKAEITKCVE